MNYLIDTYLKKPEVVNDLFNKPVSVSLKVDGSAFQIGYDAETDSVTYHSRGGSSKSLGPVIDDYPRLFRKDINVAIEHFEQRKDIVKKNKFYAIEMFDGRYILLTVLKLNGDIVSTKKEMEDIAAELDIDSVPILFEGTLNDKHKEHLMTMMTLDENTSNDVFKKYLVDTFGSGDYTKFTKGPEVEGIVLTWDIGGVPTQYKIINPAFKSRHKQEIDASKQQAETERESLNALIEALYNIINVQGEHKSDNWVTNLDLNFAAIFDDEKNASEIIRLGRALPVVKKSFWELQDNRASDTIKGLIKSYGDIIRVIYEKYMMNFYKPKKRNFIISKEFQAKLNSTIERLKSIKESSLRNYLVGQLL